MAVIVVDRYQAAQSSSARSAGGAVQLVGVT